MVKDITDQQFEEEVLKTNIPVLIDFWAEWCGPCKQIAPILDEISEELKNKVKIVKLNIDNNPDTPTKLGVRGIPALILFKDGVQLATKVGSCPKSTLLDWLNSYL